MDMLKEPILADWDSYGSSHLGLSHLAALRAAALVCSCWRDPAQRALPDEVYLSFVRGEFMGKREQLLPRLSVERTVSR